MMLSFIFIHIMKATKVIFWKEFIPKEIKRKHYFSSCSKYSLLQILKHPDYHWFRIYRLTDNFPNGILKRILFSFYCRYTEQYPPERSSEWEHLFQNFWFYRSVERGEYIRTCSFLIILTEDFGIKPLLNDAIYLNPEKGIYEHFSSHHCFDDSTSALWKSILEEGYSVKLTNTERRRLLESILVYYSIHIPEFKTRPHWKFFSKYGHKKPAIWAGCILNFWYSFILQKEFFLWIHIAGSWRRSCNH